MRINKNGIRNLQDWSAQDFPFVPTPAADHMLELLAKFETRLHFVGTKLERQHPGGPLTDVLAAMERLRLFCQQFV